MAEIHDTFLELGSVDSTHSHPHTHTHTAATSSSISTSASTNARTDTSEVTVSITVSKTCKRALYGAAALFAIALIVALSLMLTPDSTVVTVNVPVWQSGATLDYSIFRQGRNSELVRAINVVGNTGNTEIQHYILGSEGMDDAVNHAVNNMFPFFGRVTLDNLSVYENGEPQPIFGTFPIVSTRKGDVSWDFSLLGKAWRGRVTSVTPSVVTFQAVERAESENGENGDEMAIDTTHTLDYSLDVAAGFVGHMTLIEIRMSADAAPTKTQTKIFDMTMNKHLPAGSYVGKAFFVRATDIFDRRYSNDSTTKSNKNKNETFSVGQHRKDGSWDFLVYSVDATVACMEGNKATLTLTGVGDGVTRMDKSFARCVKEAATTGTIAQPIAAQYKVSTQLLGKSTALRLRVAGGLLYTYTV